MSETRWTPGPWFVSGVRYRMNGGEWHNVNRYNEATKKDDNIACVGYDPRTGDGMSDARLIAAAPDIAEALEKLLSVPIVADYVGDNEHLDAVISAARAALARAKGTEPQAPKIREM